METETDPGMDVSVRISAEHHAPRRGQPLNKATVLANPRIYWEFPPESLEMIRTGGGGVKASSRVYKAGAGPL